MALDIPLPWIERPDTIGALSAGASAGNAAARTVISRDENTARLAEDAARLNASVSEASARLSQNEYLANMAAQTRKEIAEQNRLRDNQKLAIEQAYHTAALGMAKDRLDQQKMLADAKGREAALRLQREAQFGSAVAGGMSVMDAYKQFPVPASVVNSFVRAQPKPEKPLKVGKTIVEKQPDGTYKEVYKDTGGTDDIASLLGSANPNTPQPASSPSLIDKAKSYLGIGVPKDDADMGMMRVPSEKPTQSSFGKPKVGEIRAGYRFKGGDPKSQDNWELVNEGQ